MNRQERRKLERSGMSKSQVMTKYCDEIYTNAYEQGRQDAIEIIFYMTAYTLQYKLGFGRKRLGEIMRAIYTNIDSFGTGQLYREDYPEIKRQIIEDYGVALIDPKKKI